MSLKANEVKMAIFQYHRKHKTGPSPALVLGIGSTQDLGFRGEDANVHKHRKLKGKKELNKRKYFTKVFYEREGRRRGRENSPQDLDNQLISSALCLSSHSIAAHPPIPVQFSHKPAPLLCSREEGVDLMESMEG